MGIRIHPLCVGLVYKGNCRTLCLINIPNIRLENGTQSSHQSDISHTVRKNLVAGTIQEMGIVEKINDRLPETRHVSMGERVMATSE